MSLQQMNTQPRQDITKTPDGIKPHRVKKGDQRGQLKLKNHVIKGPATWGLQFKQQTARFLNIGCDL